MIVPELTPHWGFTVFRAGEYELSSVLSELGRRGFRVTRDVVVSSDPGNDDLRAEPGDFWFHSDGCFLEAPPAVVLIQVLTPGDGAKLEVLDLDPIKRQFPVDRYLFGTSVKSHAAPVFESLNGCWRVRYRKDYMMAPAGAATLDSVHELVERRAASSAVSIGCLDPSDCLMLNNWTHLHRRTAFAGVRAIRRIWLSEEGQWAMRSKGRADE